MRISLHFLKRYLARPLPPPEVLERLFPEIGIECEEVTPLKEKLSGWRAARVERIEEAESLCLTLWEGKKRVTALSRDRSLTPGVLVPLREEGGEVHIGSEWELSLGGAWQKVYRLPQKVAPGTPLSELFPEDHLFDLAITPNRGDLLSYLGIARDLSARLRIPLRYPGRLRAFLKALEHDSLQTVLASLSGSPRKTIPGFHQDLLIDDPGAIRYGLVSLRFLHPLPLESPEEWRFFLGRSGIRSLHPLVDLTNLILLELGQPLHAFSQERIHLPLTVREARPHETLRFLDGVTRTFQGGELLIADESGPLALAGVMGGEESGVGPHTQEILLESAYFEPARVMRSRRSLGLYTESSYRFERGTDPMGVELGILRFLELCQKEQALRDVQVLRAEVRGAMPPPRSLPWDRSRAERLAGVPLPAREVNPIFRRLGIIPVRSRIRGGAIPLKSMSKGSKGSSVLYQVPRYRHDLVDLPDLVEELLRMKGYETVPSTLPSFAPLPLKPRAPLAPLRPEAYYRFREELADFLVARGFLEGIHLSFASEERAPLPSPVIRNPIGAGEDRLRAHLLPGLLEVLAGNEREGEKHLKLFEIGTVFWGTLPEVKEEFHLGILLSGSGNTGLDRHTPADLLDLKGLVEALLRYLRLSPFSFSPIPSHHPLHPFFEREEGLIIEIQGEGVGVLGRVNRTVLVPREIRSAPLYATLNLDTLFRLSQERPLPRFEPLPRFPFAERDFSFLYPRGKPVGTLLATLEQTLPGLIAPLRLESLKLFDYYAGEKLQDAVAVGIRIRLRHPERTLTHDEIEAASRNLIELAKEQGARLRTA